MSLVRRTARLAWLALVLEVTMYRSLFRWVFRRPAVGPEDETVGYAQQVTPVMWLWIFASAMELPLVHVLLPWHTARLVAIVLGLWGLVWMLGMLGGLRTYPHLLTPEMLRVRNGALVEVPVPWRTIAAVTPREQDLPSTVRTLQPLESEGRTDLRVGVSGRVNLTVELSSPIEVTVRGKRQQVDLVSFWVDEPRRAASRIRELAAARADA